MRMPEYCPPPGTVVRALAGRDAGGLFVVTGAQRQRVFIADGRRRKLSAPKAKNQKHLEETGRVLELSGIKSDKHLSRLLAALRTDEEGTVLV